MNENDQLEQVVDIAIAAGKEILEVYAGEFAVQHKTDGSPLTEADRRAHELIHARLLQLEPRLPVLSEESGARAFEQRRGWARFWLVDPLDGTKGFIRRNDEFTVNIALIEGSRPVLGVVHAPVTGVSHYAAAGAGAFKTTADADADADGKAAPGKAAPVPIRVKKFNRERAVMVASRAHAGAAVEAYRARLAGVAREVAVTGIGSSLKICLVAEGLADIYPRLGPTSEWDTAAAQCVLEAAGGSVTALSGEPLAYNKADILNPWFLAAGDRDFDWGALAQGLE